MAMGALWRRHAAAMGGGRHVATWPTPARSAMRPRCSSGTAKQWLAHDLANRTHKLCVPTPHPPLSCRGRMKLRSSAPTPLASPYGAPAPAMDWDSLLSRLDVQQQQGQGPQAPLAYMAAAAPLPFVQQADGALRRPPLQLPTAGGSTALRTAQPAAWPEPTPACSPWGGPGSFTSAASHWGCNTQPPNANPNPNPTPSVGHTEVGSLAAGLGPGLGSLSAYAACVSQDGGGPSSARRSSVSSATGPAALQLPPPKDPFDALSRARGPQPSPSASGPWPRRLDLPVSPAAAAASGDTGRRSLSFPGLGSPQGASPVGSLWGAAPTRPARGSPTALAGGRRTQQQQQQLQHAHSPREAPAAALDGVVGSSGGFGSSCSPFDDDKENAAAATAAPVVGGASGGSKAAAAAGAPSSPVAAALRGRAPGANRQDERPAWLAPQPSPQGAAWLPLHGSDDDAVLLQSVGEFAAGGGFSDSLPYDLGEAPPLSASPDLAAKGTHHHGQQVRVHAHAT